MWSLFQKLQQYHIVMADSGVMMTLDVYNQVNYVIILIIAKIAQMKLAVVSIQFNKQVNYVIILIIAKVAQMKQAVVSIKFVYDNIDHCKERSDETSCSKYQIQ